MIENERRWILVEDIQSTISSIIPIKNERQEYNILTSHQSRIKNVHHCPSFLCLCLLNGQRAERRGRKKIKNETIFE
jgi:dTDP-D-glucose 4,6-dehydratase